MRRDTELVKNRAGEAPKEPLRADFRRHFQGYELGLVTIGVALGFALLALPRASEPSTLPLPVVDRAAVQRTLDQEHELVRQAESRGLSFEVRAVGTSIRHFGHSMQAGLDTYHDRQDIRERLQRVQDKGQMSQLLELRAVQSQFFLEALRRYEQTGKSDTDLDELGAGFLLHARKSGWFDATGRCLADEGTRLVLFRMHWADLIERRTVFPFAPSLNDLRGYYRFQLLHPEREAALSTDTTGDVARLRVVRALAEKDLEYPALFAQGTLLYRLGDSQAAASAFRSHLGRNESGPYALLARNYLIRALEDVGSE